MGGFSPVAHVWYGMNHMSVEMTSWAARASAQTKDGLKMGKSLGNVLEPGPLVRAYGSDAVRLFFIKEILFGQARNKSLLLPAHAVTERSLWAGMRIADEGLYLLLYVPLEQACGVVACAWTSKGDYLSGKRIQACRPC